MTQPPASTLRLACCADSAALAAMSRSLIETGLGWRYTPQRMAALLADPDMCAVVAESSAGVSGFALMQFGDDHGHLVLLAVGPAQRRSGIASALLQWLIASARVAGLAAVKVELRIDNFGALALYRRLGFTETGLDPDYYATGIGARRMVLRLRLS